MADGNKTEQPTERRRAKAREKGQVVRSRELPGALAASAALYWMSMRGRHEVAEWQGLYRNLLEYAATREIGPASPVLHWNVIFALRWMAMPVLAVWCISVMSTLAQGGLVFASEAIGFKPERMNPAQKLQQIFSLSGVSATLKSLLPFGVILALGLQQIRNAWPLIGQLSEWPLRTTAAWIGGEVLALGWKCCLVLLIWSAVDYLLQRQKMEGDLKMSREEIKEEFKESEGNPQVKAKIRRLQRQVRRQQMLQATKKASVVVTNPTHYALALEYRPDMTAPVLVAKGLDRLAEEIKQIAVWNDVPLVENRPLAHALYRTVEVGQPIPSKLYTAVAEVLAAVYRAQAQLKRR